MHVEKDWKISWGFRKLWSRVASVKRWKNSEIVRLFRNTLSHAETSPLQLPFGPQMKFLRAPKESGRVSRMMADLHETFAMNWRQHCETSCEGFRPLRRGYRDLRWKLQNFIYPELLDLQRRSKVLWKAELGGYRLYDFHTLPSRKWCEIIRTTLPYLNTLLLWIHTNLTFCV